MFGVLAGAAYVAYRLVAPSLGLSLQQGALASSGTPTIPAGIRSIGAPFREYLPTANTASNLASVGWSLQPKYGPADVGPQIYDSNVPGQGSTVYG